MQSFVKQTYHAILPALILFASGELGFASDWTNTSVGDWFVDTNWSAGVPNANTSAFISNGGTALLNAPGATAEDVYVSFFPDAPTGGKSSTFIVSKSNMGTIGTLTAESVSVGKVRFDTPPAALTGTLNISSGAVVRTTGTTTTGYGVEIGESTSGGGPVTGNVDVNGAGSLLDAQVGPIVLGLGNGTGTLVVENGGKAQSAGGSIGIGSATVKGSGSVWQSSNTISVGSAGSANSSLNILTGGLVQAPFLMIYNGLVDVDTGSSTISGLTISGVKPQPAGGAVGSIAIGNNGAGRMEISAGGTIVGYQGYVGGNSGSVGSALITDAKSKWSAAGSIWVGNSGSGTLDVLNGGTVTSSGNGYLAFANNTTGLATISGTGSSWSMNDHLYIGGNGAAPGGSGQLVLQNGGTVTAVGIVLWDTGILTLGANATLKGPLTAMGGAIETTNNITFANDFTLGTEGLFVRTNGFNSTFSGAISGNGGLTKSGSFTGSGNGTLTLTGNSNYSGPTTISFGKLVVDGSIASAVTVNGSATLAGSGTVGGLTIKSGGILAPGHSPGILTVNGNYTQQSGGVLNVELSGAAPGAGFDQVAVNGSATVDGTLNLSLVNGFRPTVGETFAIITSSSETGNFSTINSSGFTVRSDASNAGIVLTVTSVVPGAPVITSSTSASGSQGQPFSYQITATESPTSFAATGLPPGLSVDASTGVISGTPTTVGSFNVTISATNSTATGSAALTITISAPAPDPTTLANISTRLRVETGDNVLIGGFIITGTQPKKVIIRAIGPSLPFADDLADPILELHDSSGALLDSNDNWVDSPNKQAIIDSTIAPTNDLESAIVATLPADGSGYTAIVRGVNNGTGIGVVEAYDLDRTVDSKLANISTRGLVQTGDDVLIAGTIVVGQTPQRVLVEALGPSLSLPGKLEDPILELRDGNGTLLDSNDNWVDSPNKQAIIDSTIAPSNDVESAIIATLPAGGAQYTAIVRGAGGTTGIAVVEVFALQ